jgi:hypothetical protein
VAAARRIEAMPAAARPGLGADRADAGMMSPRETNAMRRTRLILALILMAWAAPVLPASAQRVALVVGNGAYASVPRLANPGADAAGVAAALRAAGFSVELLRDAGREALGAALRRFGQSADGAELALFYFAGHGIQVGGENHLLPVDARLAHARDVDFELVPLALITRTMQGARARVVILDACRDNPLATQMRGLSGTRSVGRGLAQVDSVDLGTLVAFSTSPGSVAQDGAGRNSPFAAALLRHLATPGLEIRQLMTRVRRSVVEATGGQQVPWDNSSLITEVVLHPGRGQVAPPAAPLAALPVPGPATPQRRPAPAAMPAPPPAGSALAFAAARQVAYTQGIPLPAELPAPGAGRGAHPLLGAWGGSARWNRTGRQYLLLVLGVDAVGGTADVLLAAGIGQPRSFSDGLQPGWSRHRATLSGSTLRWQDNYGDNFEARRVDFFAESVEIVHTRIGGGTRTSNPQGQIALPRIE